MSKSELSEMVGKLLRRVSNVLKSGHEDHFLEAGIDHLNTGEHGKALSCFDELIRFDSINK